MRVGTNSNHGSTFWGDSAVAPNVCFTKRNNVQTHPITMITAKQCEGKYLCGRKLNIKLVRGLSLIKKKINMIKARIRKLINVSLVRA